MKGTKVHAFMGYAYVASMLIVNITALMIYRLFGSFGIFHYAAIMSLINLSIGMYAVIKKPNKRWLITHLSWMFWSVFGLYMAFVSEVLTRIPSTPFFAMLGLATAIVAVVGGIIFSYYLRAWKRKIIY
ncbi:hypothetical protein E1140_06115 [Fulvivirga lutimaris]|nr:hypothetical protein [Fulvivirga lutimaris]